ncbi:hypothetical protein LCGC14_1263150 [marine sediment metagenome]|uniref:Uncharacterized protein n=1 Tax=marine sediment metagenome TaxID=412755 RepID=A0A0F9L015_9ZZZZ
MEIKKLIENPVGDLQGVKAQIWKVERKVNEIVGFLNRLENNTEITAEDNVIGTIYVTKDEMEKMYQSVKKEVYKTIQTEVKEYKKATSKKDDIINEEDKTV